MKNLISIIALFASLMITTSVTGCTKVAKNDKSKIANKKVEKKTEKKEVKKEKITAKVLLKTTKGDMLIGLYGNDAPVTVKNFLQYVKDGFYTGLLFHRVIPGFVIQGGGMEPGMIKKVTRSPIKLEIAEGLKHKKGILSMARTQVRDSGTSQFFICLGDVPSLDNQYAVFGELIKGTKVLDTIAKAPTGKVGFHRNVPTEDIKIISATIVK